MVRSKRLLVPVTIACIVGVFVIALLHFIVHRTGEGRSDPTLFYEEGYLPADTSLDPLAAIGEDYKVTQEFVSNLPILVFSLSGDKESGWESGMLSVFNWENEMNSLYVSPTQAIQVRLKTESTGTTTKPDFDIEFVDSSGNPRGVEILGMPEDTSFQLNSMRNDLSMVRTYTAYRTASEFLDFVPHVEYCEILLERDGETFYQGLYQLRENIGVGPTKVNLNPPEPDKTRVDYFVLSDTSRHGRLMGTRQIDGKYVRGYTSLIYPNEEELTKEQLDFIESDYNTIVTRVQTLNDYSILVDLDSLMDYYIFNMYFGNTSAGKSMTYMYRTVGGKLQFGPVYDFDLALGNLNGEDPDPENVKFDQQIFFNDLATENSFVAAFLRRFVELRRTVLKDDVVYRTIDEARDYLAIARQRDDYRWRQRDTDTGVAAIYRPGTIESNEYERDLYRIKAYLTEHASEVRNTLALIEEEQRIEMRFTGGNTLLLFVSLVLFFIPSILVNRKG